MLPDRPCSPHIQLLYCWEKMAHIWATACIVELVELDTWICALHFAHFKRSPLWSFGCRVGRRDCPPSQWRQCRSGDRKEEVLFVPTDHPDISLVAQIDRSPIITSSLFEPHGVAFAVLEPRLAVMVTIWLVGSIHILESCSKRSGFCHCDWLWLLLA